MNDTYPAYISWATYETIRAMLQDNYAEYDRNKTRGVPRPGKALLHGLVYCGECGHKLVVQYKAGTRYLCNHLRQQYRVPVCQFIPADPVDDYVVQAFFAALSPLELDAYSRALAVKQDTDQALDTARRQQLERLRYQATLAERQFNHVDPDNRLVAAELERRWETALSALHQAESDYAKTPLCEPSPPPLSSELQAAFTDIGRRLPELWPKDVLSPTQKKALLRCLIDKVIVHRSQRDHIHTRIVWKGGETTTQEIPIHVHRWSELTDSAELEQRILDLHHQGLDDETISAQLSAEGYRSPMNTTQLLPNTVKCLRLKHKLFVKRSQSHPRRIPGYLTVPQIADAIGVTRYWLYDRINKGTIAVTRHPATGLYLFPDRPQTLRQFRQFKAGRCQQLRFEDAP